jgi:hypothetical protein
MLKDLIKLANRLDSFGLKKDADFLDVCIQKLTKNYNFIKSAFINEAKIKVLVLNDTVVSTLRGRLPSNREAEFGICRIFKFNNSEVKIASSPASSVWEFHREIYDPEYSGLGYMNDLLTSAIFQVQINGGIVFNGVGTEINGSSVSQYGQAHTSESLGNSLEKTPVIIFRDQINNRHVIFDSSEKELAKSTFLKAYGEELSDSILDGLFSRPYSMVDLEDINSDLRDYNNSIISGFKITATSSKTSIPVSFSYDQDELEIKDPNEELIISIEEKIDELYKQRNNQDLDTNKAFTLRSKYFELIGKIFTGDTSGSILYDIIEYREPDSVSPKLMNNLLESFVQKNFKVSNEFLNRYGKNITFNKAAYESLKPEMESLWEQSYYILNEEYKIKSQISKYNNQISELQNEKENEYDARRAYVGDVRNRRTYTNKK